MIAPAAFVADTRWRVPAAPLPAFRARTGARQPRRRPVPVLASAAIAGLITMVLAVTVGAALIRHPVGALPPAPPGHPAGGIAAAPPARPPSSASPSRKAGPGTSPGDTGTVRVIASSHRAVTGSVSSRERGHEKIRRHRDGSHAGHGHGHGRGNVNAQVLSISS